MLTIRTNASLDESRRCKVYSRPTRTCKVGTFVYSSIEGVRRAESVPSIKLSGRWLNDAGIVMGASLSVEAHDGVITLAMTDRRQP